MKIRIKTIDYSGSIVDGPGIRTVLFVQGCERHCAGCHNPGTWDLNGGIEREVSEIVAELRGNCVNKKITISGGEPLLQSEGIVELVKTLPDFDIALYTGAELKEVPEELLKHVRYIKVGCYIEAKRTTTTPYIGSSNQSFLKLR